MRSPTITIITPSFNQAPYLEHTIRSVLDQGYPRLEYFIIDGGSTDGSVEIIRRYERHLAGWTSEPDRGQMEAINKGLERATGQIVAFLNSDDIYLPGALATVGKLMAADGGPRWLVGGCMMIDGQHRERGHLPHHAPTSFAEYLMHTTGMIPQPSSFWEADLFRRHGRFDLTLHCCFDYEFNCRLLAGGERPHLIEQPLAAFRVHPESKGSTQPQRFGLERLRVARRYAPLLPLPQRYRLWRSIGYRRRLCAIEAARRQARPLQLWGEVLLRPWWIASEDVREALLHPDHKEAA